MKIKKILNKETVIWNVCAHCHGQNGDGKGSITHPVYSAIPAYYDDVMIRPRSQTTMKYLRMVIFTMQFTMVITLWAPL